MLGQSYIHVFDGLIKPEHLKVLDGLELGIELPLEELELGDELDQQIFKAVAKALREYNGVYPELSQNWSQNKGDDGYMVRNPRTTELRYSGGDFNLIKSQATVVMFTNSQRYLEFPHQASQYQGRPGRIVVFPAYWTHQYRLIGQGPVITTNHVEI